MFFLRNIKKVMPTFGTHLKDDLAQKLQKHLDEQYEGKASRFLRELVVAYFEGESLGVGTTDQRCFEKLVAQFCDAATQADLETSLHYVSITQIQFTTQVLRRGVEALRELQTDQDWRELEWHLRLVSPMQTKHRSTEATTYGDSGAIFIEPLVAESGPDVPKQKAMKTARKNWEIAKSKRGSTDTEGSSA